MKLQHFSSQTQRRAAFTVVELLVVISIIAILMSLTLAVVGAAITQARASATEATIRKVQSLLSARMKGFYAIYASGTPSSDATVRNTTEYSVSTPSSLSDATRLVLARKLLFKKFFPQQATDVNAQLQPNITKDSNSSEILYDFLTQSNVLGAASVLVDSFSTSEVIDLDNDGLPEFVDAWGRPLRFYRWPTRLFRPNGYPGAVSTQNAVVMFATIPSDSDLARDPDDPLGLMADITSFNPETSGYSTPETFHTPLVISAGADGAFGLFAPDDATNFGTLAAVDTTSIDSVHDNVTFLNVRAGGR